MIVYRVESRDGIGFYRVVGLGSNKISYMELGQFHDRIHHPEPEDDGIPHFSSLMFYGFRNRKHLQNWFLSASQSSINAVAAHKVLFITSYEIDEEYVVHGNKQCVFIRNKAKKLDLMLPFTYTNLIKFGDMKL